MKVRVSLCVASGVLLLLASSPTGEAASAGDPVQFGARAGKGVAAFQSYEARVGHAVSDARLYYRWDQPFPDATATWAKDNGRTIFMSVFAKRVNGSVVLWRDIAAAQPGSGLYSQMQTWAQRIKAIGQPVYFSFNHEPEAASSGPMGSTTEYKAAWQRFITILRAEGATNAEYVFIGTSFGFGKGRTQKYYPGDAYVDAIGVDGYNWYTCRPNADNPWFSMEQLLGRMMPFAAEHPGIPLMVVEFGTTEDPANPNRKAQWYSDAQQLFKSPPYDRFVLVNEFDTLKACAFRPDSSATSLAAFKTWLNDPYYSG